ncbi:MAG: peroxide stress protein YaaA [Chitinophagales bacterium]|nr:peroxide stress protein YaaA [Chitinophagales bacterium]
MIVILSPSKTMNAHIDEPPSMPLTTPVFQKKATLLSAIIAELSKDELAKLMTLSAKLAEQTWQRFQNLKAHHAIGNQAALYSYTGEVYSGLHEQAMTDEDIRYAQDHLQILSGMYGILRPLDKIMPYRLEMAAKLTLPADKNLYAFWRENITTNLKQSIEATKSQFLANLASDEYAKVVYFNQLDIPTITFDFHEVRNGVKKFVSFNAKRARGLMASYIIKNRITQPKQLTAFNSEGYQYDADASTDLHFAYIRE